MKAGWSVACQMVISSPPVHLGNLFSPLNAGTRRSSRPTVSLITLHLPGIIINPSSSCWADLYIAWHRPLSLSLATKVLEIGLHGMALLFVVCHIQMLIFCALEHFSATSAPLEIYFPRLWRMSFSESTIPLSVMQKVTESMCDGLTTHDISVLYAAWIFPN